MTGTNDHTRKRNSVYRTGQDFVLTGHFLLNGWSDTKVVVLIYKQNERFTDFKLSEKSTSIKIDDKVLKIITENLVDMVGLMGASFYKNLQYDTVSHVIDDVIEISHKDADADSCTTNSSPLAITNCNAMSFISPKNLFVILIGIKLYKIFFFYMGSLCTGTSPRVPLFYCSKPLFYCYLK